MEADPWASRGRARGSVEDPRLGALGDRDEREMAGDDCPGKPRGRSRLADGPGRTAA